MPWNPFKRWRERIYEDAYWDGSRAADRIREERRREIEEINLRNYIDRPVIVIHEGGNPVIGYGRRIEHVSRAGNPMLVVADYASNPRREVLCFGHILHYTEQRYNALLRLTPEERWALVAKNAVGWTEVTPREGAELALDPQQLHSLLERQGFFIHLPEPGELLAPLPKRDAA